MELSIVVPVYKSQLILPELLDRIDKYVTPLSISFEVILTDDFSNDGTYEVMKILAKKYPFAKIFRNKKNKGLPANSAQGISLTQGQYIVTIDDDLEYCPSDIVRLYQLILKTNADIVFGISSKKYKTQRKSDKIARLRNNILNKLWKKPITDSFKIFKRTVVFDKDKFIMNTHFEGHINRIKNDICIEYCEVAYYPRFQGSSNYTFFKKIRMLYQMHKGFGSIEEK